MNSLVVTVLTPHGRRQNVQVQPHMTLLQVLEEVCKKHDFKSEEYCLKHHNRELDLTQMFRFSGLPNKCFLEMDECKKKRQEDEPVVICVQLENGLRLQEEFLPNQTLKDVLNKLVPTSLEENPVLIYMRAEIYGDLLEKTTLKSLGLIKGKAMFRLLNRNPEELKNQASYYIPSTKVASDKLEVEKENKTVAKSDQKDDVGIAGKIRNLISKEKQDKPSAEENNKNESIEVETSKDKEVVSVEPKKEYDWGTGGRSMKENLITQMDVDDNGEVQEEVEIFELGERNAVLFSLDSAQKVVDDIPDSFFDLTVDDLKVLLRDLHKQASGNADAPLLTAKLREIDESNKTLSRLNQYKKSVIRIQFPDRMVLQGTFGPVDSIEDVYAFVRNYLKDPSLDFFLFTTPPKNILDKKDTLVEANCIPAAVLHFGVNDLSKQQEEQQGSYLKEELKQTSATGAILAASKSRGLTQVQNSQKSEFEAGPSARRTTPLASTGAIPKQPRPESFKKSSTGRGPAEKIPKWFKTNK